MKTIGKPIFLCFFLCCMAFSALNGKSALAEESRTGYNIDYVDQGVEYSVIHSMTGVSWAVVGYDETVKSEITIPESIEYQGASLAVGGIVGFALEGCQNLKSISIPANVGIAGGAFAGCTQLSEIKLSPGSAYEVDEKLNIYSDNKTKLVHASPVSDHLEIADTVTEISGDACAKNMLYTEITVPDHVTSIGSEAFLGCANMENFVLPAGVTMIEGYAFSGCGIKSFEIPSSLEIISDGVFKDCEKLEQVIIPETVTEIGIEAFSGCKVLDDITISANVQNIGEKAFQKCGNLKNFSIAEGNQSYFYENGCIYSETVEEDDEGNEYKKTTLISALSWVERARILEQVTEIANSAAADNPNLTAVKLPSQLRSISSEAFRNCTALEKIYLPDSVAEIGTYAFSGCSSLSKVRIPSSLGIIDNYLFAQCGSLGSVKLPESLEAIGEGVFAGCASLKSVVIPASVEEISGSSEFSQESGNIFENCSDDLIVYGVSGSLVEKYTSAVSVAFSSDIGAAAVEEADDSFEEISVEEPEEVPEENPGGDSEPGEEIGKEDVENADIENTEGNIADNNNDPEKEESGAAVTKGTVLESTESGCRIKVTAADEESPEAAYVLALSNAKTITVPKKVTVDGITYKITSIGKNAFKNCKKMKKLVIKSTTIRKIEKNALKKVPSKCVVKVPKNKKAEYKKLLKKSGYKGKIK